MLLRGEEIETFPKSDRLQKRLDLLLTIACLRSHPGTSSSPSGTGTCSCQACPQFSPITSPLITSPQ